MSEKSPHCDSAIEGLFREDGVGVFYLNELRSARNAALADAEGFMAVIHTLELMGQKLMGSIGDLGKYKKKLNCVAGLSFLSRKADPTYHVKFSTLYGELQRARNDAVHQGAYARILTDHAVDLAIIFEDALMSKSSKVSQFMVRDVVEAKPWQPVSYARQQMLKHSFSYLPIWYEGTWKLISADSVARYLRDCSDGERDKRLATTIEKAVNECNENDRLGLLLVKAVSQETNIRDSNLMQSIGAEPILVIDPKRQDEKDGLVGILASIDIL